VASQEVTPLLQTTPPYTNHKYNFHLHTGAPKPPPHASQTVALLGAILSNVGLPLNAEFSETAPYETASTSMREKYRQIILARVAYKGI
jgi:hypothetical protein